MRGAALVAALSVLDGCAGDRTGGQTIRVAPTAPESSEEAPRTVEPVEPRYLPSLAAAAPRSGFVTVQPSHLMTAAGRTSPSLIFGPGTEDLYDLVQGEPERVRLRGERGEVRVTMVPGSEAHGDVTRRLVIEPAEPLDDTWYELEIDLPIDILGSVREDGRALSRFRPDAHPVLQGIFAADREGQRIIEARFSERVEAAEPPSGWRIWDDSGPLACSVVGPGFGQAEARAVWTCGRAEVGTLHIDFGGVLTTVLGAALMTPDDRVLTRVAVVAQAPADGDGIVALR